MELRLGVEMIARPFFVMPYFQCPRRPDVYSRIPPHRLVIEPLVAVAAEICVHQKRVYELEIPIPPHEKRRSAWVLNLSAELVRGWETFWNAGCWARGSISLKLPAERIDWEGIFSWTQYGGVWSSKRQMLKGTPSEALTYSDRNAAGDMAVACFSASNGIQFMDLWFDAAKCDRMNQLARDTCRSFVRFIEHGKYPREIIYDRAPYNEMV
jgi:hypothetical protein